MNGDHGWAPLLDGARRDQLLDTVAEITTALGDSASLTLLAYAARLDRFPEAEARATRRLDALVASLAETARPLGLWGGLAGAGWTVAHLAEVDDAEAVCAAIDDVLLDHLDQAVWPGDYDLIGGLVGIGVAALERLAAPSARRVAGRVLDHLEAAAREVGDGLAWFTAAERLPDWQRALCPEGHYDLGLAHGVPGVIGLTAGFVTAGFEVTRSRRLLEGALRWLRAVAPVRAPARFPAWSGPGLDDRPARPAWCYGDAGVAVTLLAAARALDDAELEAEAIAIAHAMARSLDGRGVVATGICHGAAGVAHIFNRMYQTTGDALLGEAARGWIDRLLAMRRDREPEPGVLVGASGVALVLLAAATELEPGWDRRLLVTTG